jgi:16S rRNA (cytosine1402-N4)-methyltransferase
MLVRFTKNRDTYGDETEQCYMKNTHKNNQNTQIDVAPAVSNKHYPVLLDAVLQHLEPKEGESYLDLTAGYGGHASAMLDRTLGKPHKTTLVDRDQNAIAHLSRKFAGQNVELVHKDFLGASRELIATGKRYDLILADLGVSSPHLDDTSRGFSFRADGPLDMRMDERQSLTAAEIVNSYEVDELARIIHEYGEEPRAKKIARLIAEHRPVQTTGELAEVVARAWPGHSKVHPATRTFQALRIAVNDELELLAKALPIWIDLLAPGGRIAVISFHSLEDRLVKQAFQETAGDRYDAVLRLLTKQPVTADASELVFNPRSRSAKLRAAVKK